MDEITLLASSLPDAPPPAPEVLARARARLAAHEVRRRPRHTWALIIGAATATAAVVTAAALTATLLAHARAPASAPVSASASPTPRSGARLLLELADRVERLPVETGAYWRTRTLSRGPIPVGAASARYLIDSTLDMRQWTPAKPGAHSVQEVRSTGYEPLTSQDERIWREQGSPKQWRVPAGCVPPKPSGCEHTLTEGGRTPPGFMFWVSSKGQLLDHSVSSFTLAELAALPADPALLRKRLAGYHATQVKRGIKALSKDSFEEFLVEAVPKMLGLPVGPGVRATLLRMYAELPGGVAVREIVDSLGRSALAVDLRDNELRETTRLPFGGHEVPVTHETLLDSLTGRRIGARYLTLRVEDGFPKGTVLGSETVSEVGWTDERPVLPSGCRLKGNGVCR
ncbi:CU044_5270 family protein [Streptosporangium subroseum]|uniref:CU044_5270 family protein n=1 Tax=Streptosporangium subroseum TaxID=106412 RepID=UPI0030912FF3|nr:CU044_5270 family protein [Streptosporangium subroseum]